MGSIDDGQLRRMVDDADARQRVSAVDITDAFLNRIEQLDSGIGAFIAVCDDLAREEAQAVEGRRLNGELLPLTGVTVAVKDNIDVAGVCTTVGSRFFSEHMPAKDAEVVRRIRAAGGVIVGKTALHEFLYGSTTQNEHYGPCRNPWDLACIPGGSSGGSGAAVAADFCVVALGSDTGGSVRIPASLNGISGLRPTRGFVSTSGSFPLSPLHDTIGPMARSVHDVRRLLNVIAGHDSSDPWSERSQSHGTGTGGCQGLDGLRLGVPADFCFDASTADDVIDAVQRAVVRLGDLGVRVSEITLVGVEELDAVWDPIARATAFAIHSQRLKAHRDWFEADIAERLEMGSEVRGETFARAILEMQEWRRYMLDVFERVDVIVTPTTPNTAPRAVIAGSALSKTSVSLRRFTMPWSLAGLPALSIPCGFDRENLPIGLQLVAAPWAEDVLMEIGIAYQATTDFHKQRPPSLPEHSGRAD